MSTKKTQKTQRRKAKNVQVGIPESLVRAVDREVRKSRLSGRETSRASIIRDMIGLGVARRLEAEAEDQASRTDVRDRLLKEASALAEEAAAHESSGGRKAAARLYLAAASREIEAMCYAPHGDESGLKSAIIMALKYVKRGSGYKRLPEFHEPIASPDVV